MKLLPLAANVCALFSSASGELRTVQKVKDSQVRDVVTSLDERLHETAASFVESHLTGCKLMSEEDKTICRDMSVLAQGEWLVVDPLDGSNNYALSMPGYGFMAAHVINGKVENSVVVLPEHDLYFMVDDERLLVSQSFAHPKPATSGSVYYAYPPKMGDLALRSRLKLIELIDSRSSGLYRYGSSCVGLYNLIRGRHSAFIGHDIRIWDALAYFPIFKHFGISAAYHIGTSGGLTLVASSNQNFINQICNIIADTEELAFNSLDQIDHLVISR